MGQIELEAAQRELARAYDRLRAEYGRVNRPVNWNPNDPRIRGLIDEVSDWRRIVKRESGRAA